VRSAIADARSPGWLLNWFPALFCMGLIFYFSSRSSLPRPIEEPAPNGELYRQLLHVFEYTILTGCLYRALVYHKPRQAAPAEAGRSAPWARRRWRFGGMVALALLYAVLDELHQGLVPNRDPSIRDVLTDAAGVAVALAIVSLVSLLINRRSGGQVGLRIVVVLPIPARARDEATREQQP
jgi:VanZ family protein